MFTAFQKQPLVISLPACFLGLMLVPALYGFWSNETVVARTFLYAIVLGGIALGIFSLALGNTRFVTTRYMQLITLVSFFLLTPFLFAIPVAEILPNHNYFLSYLDMVGVVTTTGLPVFETETLPLTVQIWRGLVGWFSGFLMWVFAWSVFAPMNMGGFEHLTASSRRQPGGMGAVFHVTSDPSTRFWREFTRLFPIYIWITALAALVMMICGVPPVYALSRAMGAIATFGFEIKTVEPVPGLQTYASEIVIAIVLIFALSRACFSRSVFRLHKYQIWRDAELRMGFSLIICTLVVVVLTLIFRGSNVLSFGTFGQTIWAVIFTALSFLTTTGYIAADWISVQIDLGLGSTGFILAGLAVFGGGVATTASGIKLLRVYVLVDQSRNEVEGLISPSQVRRSSARSHKQQAKNAGMAWIFFMVFILVFAALIFALCLSGASLDHAIQLTVATITNTGPLAYIFGATQSIATDLTQTSQFILVLSMVFGRLEVLAFLALLNPSSWR